ncbi:hypothetical protein SPOG_05679 [Schizosaccharomyces cryophilus OY26]|uniref:Uncharacterized protein n=1 Tax=Schizosaccharomyces cryophilus (strain OY26 / ATCC MYA-4695 / CBS 11777 / NBRC 106824 / NRRL Y48691) TaxID=653667 RepID=S9VX42_SCHCR|nr:uncharacterized protein SPOG_05679 [Schizosaccharomyces cryophilus OY26]EPY52238.1 hypothetical protein SPOG_05679 [Schizosaccharomyces cryophilus OY26]
MRIGNNISSVADLLKSNHQKHSLAQIVDDLYNNALNEYKKKYEVINEKMGRIIVESGLSEKVFKKLNQKCLYCYIEEPKARLLRHNACCPSELLSMPQQDHN